MGFFDFIGDVAKDVAPAIVGTAASFIPGVGPIAGPAAGALTASLLGDDDEASSISGGGSAQAQQNQLLDYLLGYQTPGSQFLENYSQNVFFDAEEDYKDSARAQDAFGVMNDSVQSGNTDPFTALQFMESKLSPTSEFYGTKDFARLLNADVNRDTQRDLVEDAFATNFYRAPTKKENKYYRSLADSMGQNKSPMQFNSFLNSRLANTLEGAAKGPLNQYEEMAQSYYGRAVRNPDGSKSGTYNVFGLPMKSPSSAKLTASFA